MKILVIGASGKTGHEVVSQALAAGHTVTAFVRDRSRLGIRNSRLTIATGDARRVDDLREALRGQDAVISTLGGKPRASGEGVMTRSMAALIEAAHEAGVQRVIVLSTFMLAPNFRAGLLKPLSLYYKGMNDDKRASEEALRRSQLEWTIVYATRLVDGQATGIRRLVPLSEAVTPRDKVSRADVAAFLLSQVADEAGVRSSVVLTGA
jgi:putative NADH-flavin reductase